jgi:hypothetical protein
MLIIVRIVILLIAVSVGIIIHLFLFACTIGARFDSVEQVGRLVRVLAGKCIPTLRNWYRDK